MSSTSRRPGLARRHYEAAVAFDEAAGWRTWAVHSHFALGRLLAKGRATATRRRAEELLERALADAEQSGMRLLEHRCRTELEALGGRRAAAVDVDGQAPGVLTDRELEVLRLVAEGRTNQEVGRLLHASQHTVAAHVRAILGKSGARNRVEAAAWGRRQGLIGETRPTTV